MLRVIFIIPIIQLLILGYAITTDIKNLDMSILDLDHSSKSRDLINLFSHNEYFKVKLHSDKSGNPEQIIFKGNASIVLVIPNNFSKDLESGYSPSLQVLVDGQNSNTGAIALGYCNKIITSYIKKSLSTSLFFNRALYKELKIIQTQTNVFYNPELKSVYFMIPGIISLLLTIITMLLTALAIVKERETGTLEQLLVTTLKPWQIIAGKTIPYIIIGAAEVSIAMVFGISWFHIPIIGSILVLAFCTGIYLLTSLGLGIFVSSFVTTQQQALFFSWFILVNAILLSGFFYPIENMPPWVQSITLFDPLRYYIAMIREIFLKGAGLAELKQEIFSLLAISFVVFTFAVSKFQKRIS